MSESLDQEDTIKEDMVRTRGAWLAAGRPVTGPVAEAREAAIERLREWNKTVVSRMSR